MRNQRSFAKLFRLRLTEVIKWLSLVVMMLLGPVVLGADSGSPKGALVLYDETKDFSGLALLDRRITSALKTGAVERLDIYSEFMDVSRFRDENYKVKLRNFYRQQYAGKKRDLIMAVMGPSLKFLLKHGVELFPNTSIVFCGIDRRELGNLNLGPHMTGVLVATLS